MVIRNFNLRRSQVRKKGEHWFEPVYINTHTHTFPPTVIPVFVYSVAKRKPYLARKLSVGWGHLALPCPLTPSYAAGSMQRHALFQLCNRQSDIFHASATLGFKFQLLSRTEGFEIYGTIKCIHDRTVHRGRQRVKNWRSVQCTEVGVADLNYSITVTRRHKISDVILREGLKQRIFKNTAITILGLKSEEVKEGRGKRSLKICILHQILLGGWYG